MKQPAQLYGAALVLVGLGGYVLTGMQSPTALIPSMFGVLAYGFGVLASKPERRKLAMHAVVLVAALAFLGTVGGVVELIAWLGGSPPDRPPAAISKGLTALLSLAFLVAAVRAFVRARATAPSTS